MNSHQNPTYDAGLQQALRGSADRAAESTMGLTFLVSDLVGSTRLWEEGPMAMRRAIIRHNRVLRAAIESRRGRVFSFEGDGILASFGSPRDALLAALSIQRALGAGDRKLDDGEIDLAPRLRLALHCGKAFEHDGSYLGLDVCRAARIVAAGHGGQLLLSEAARLQLHQRLPRDCRLHDLGRFRLRGISPSERIHLVEAEDLPLVTSQPTARPAFRSVLRLLRWSLRQLAMLVLMTLLVAAWPARASAAPTELIDRATAVPAQRLDIIDARCLAHSVPPSARRPSLDTLTVGERAGSGWPRPAWCGRLAPAPIGSPGPMALAPARLTPVEDGPPNGGALNGRLMKFGWLGVHRRERRLSRERRLKGIVERRVC